MAAIEKVNISYRKLDLTNQRSMGATHRDIVFAHKASASDTGFNLNSLSLPSEMSAEGFSNPTAAELSRARILNNRKNLKLVSSAKGLLVDYLSYEVSSNNRIDFVGFTADADEIFVGYLATNMVDGLSVENLSDRLTKLETYRLVTSNIDVVAPFDKILGDTSGGPITVTLTASPTVGDTVVIMDATGTFGTNNLTVARNGNNILGIADDYLLDVNDGWAEFVWVGGSRGWSVRT